MGSLAHVLIVTIIIFYVPGEKKKELGSLKASEGGGGMTLELMSSVTSSMVLGHPLYSRGPEESPW